MKTDGKASLRWDAYSTLEAQEIKETAMRKIITTAAQSRMRDTADTVRDGDFATPTMRQQL